MQRPDLNQLDNTQPFHGSWQALGSRVSPWVGLFLGASFQQACLDSSHRPRTAPRLPLAAHAA